MAQKVLLIFSVFFAGENYGTRVLDAWSPENPSSKIPALSLSDLNNEHRFSSYFLENTSFLKLQSISVGYNVPDALLQKIRMKRGRIFLQGENLLTFKLPGNTFTGYDPKNPSMYYPLPTSLTLGLNLIF